MKTTSPQPLLQRIDFYRLRGQEFFEALVKSVAQALGDEKTWPKRWPKLNPTQQGVLAFWHFWGDVENGGLTQYFYNHTDAQIPVLTKLLKAAGNAPLATLITQAAKVYRQHEKEFHVDDPFGKDGLFERMTALKKLDSPVVRLLGRAVKSLEKWLRGHMAQVALGDDGVPIAPTFSGEIATQHANGKTFEEAVIRRGVVSGGYRRYFDDGTLEHACFYEGGKVCSDYWPNGQPKHKQMKRGKLKVHEWYYPSGNIQKRFVGDSTGYAVEPVRLWHENGQLAEELHMDEDSKFGPWLKFFADGSPRLEAEHAKGKTLVIRNAWDENKKQVVKNGKGHYGEDGIDIGNSYDLFWRSDWIRSFDVKDGVPHGAGETWHDGVLWSREEYANGKRHGECTTFYDNGRMRTRSLYDKGREKKTQEFRKFDDPRPAVLMKVLAEAKLYQAWGHPVPDVFPQARDLDQVQAQLQVPLLLQQVFERNLSKRKLEDDYDDLNTYNDAITYFVMVNEQGKVDAVEFSGCGAHSIAAVDTYPPFIRKLRFEPGRIGKRKIRCRVIVEVEHTFVEG